MQNLEQTAVLRRFNRSYTQRIGALEESFLGLGLPLGAARLLYEIGVAPADTRALRARLGLDSGYLSRLLRRLQDAELVELAPDPTDRRRRTVRLTVAGQDTWSILEDRSQLRAQALVDPLSARQRRRLVEALATADLLIRAATVEIEEVPPDATSARTAVGQYVAELDRRFPGGFDAARQTVHDVDGLSRPGGAFLVALSDGVPVACGGVQTIEPGIGEVKRMWVHGGWRGAGLGSRLLQELQSRAQQLGHSTLRLDTNDTLAEAIELYRRAGYREIPPYNDNPYARLWFEKPLSGPAVGPAAGLDAGPAAGPDAG